MRKVFISDYVFNLKSEWKDLSLSDFVSLCRIKMPEKLVELYKNTGSEEKYNQISETITYEDQVKLFPEYFGKCLAVLSDIPEKIIDIIDWEQRTELFNQYMFPFAFSTVTDVPLVFNNGKTEVFEPKEVESVDYKGNVYYFPKSLKLKDLDIPLSDEPVITFAEASSIITTWQKLSEFGAEWAAYIPALYLRKEGEEYNEKELPSKARHFEGLDMESVWSLFFYILGLQAKSVVNTLQSLRVGEVIKSDPLRIRVE